MIGVIMLNTRFPRLPGDIGNPDTFDGQVIYEVVEPATVPEVVTTTPLDSSLKAEFRRAARRLEERGATVIGTSCGFLISMQDDLQSEVSVPVLTSSIVLMPEIRQRFGTDAIVGVLTFDDRVLGEPCYRDYLDSNCVLGGLPKDGELFECIRGDLRTLDPDRAADEVLHCASRLIEASPPADLLLIECTNISPYKESLQETFAHPVIDLVDAIKETASTFNRQDRSV